DIYTDDPFQYIGSLAVRCAFYLLAADTILYFAGIFLFEKHRLLVCRGGGRFDGDFIGDDLVIGTERNLETGNVPASYCNTCDLFSSVPDVRDFDSVSTGFNTFDLIIPNEVCFDTCIKIR